jgi:hypothetical protein
MTQETRNGVVVDELLRDDADCPVFGINLACAYPFPEIAAQFYRPIAARLGALDPGVYVYPDWETHVTIVTFVNFSLHRRPDAKRLRDLQALVQPITEILQPVLATSRAFPVVIGAPVLTPKAAILPMTDRSGEVARIRREVIRALEANKELHGDVTRAGMNVPGIVHSTIMRFRAAPADAGRFTTDFEEAFAVAKAVEIVIDELLLTTETKPYMREGTIAHRFPLAPI